MGNLGATEILLIFLVILLLFGAKRIPEIARGLGKGIREFKDASTDIRRELTMDDSQMRIQQPQYGGQPRDQRPYDQAPYDPTAHPSMPQAPAQHPAYAPPVEPNHPAYGSTPPPQG
ncbi:MAG: twin-arginine translocase TatA/TatE family subunit [Rhodothermales bacterium]|nr:twin-arginine translocase TatA/TatE family subunit [Rhodothermales bacterium]